MTDWRRIALLPCTVALALTLATPGRGEEAAATKPKPSYANAGKYDEVELALVRATPEEYKHKRVYFVTTYLGYISNLPWYMEQSGFKSDKFYWLRVIPQALPAMARKNDLMNALIPTLAKRKTVIVYGKVGEFRQKAHRAVFASYYIEVDYLEVCETDWKPNLPEEQINEELRGDEFLGGGQGGGEEGGGGRNGPPPPPRRWR